MWAHRESSEAGRRASAHGVGECVAIRGRHVESWGATGLIVCARYQTIRNCSEQGSPLPTVLPAPVSRVRHELKRRRSLASGATRFQSWAMTPEGRANAHRLKALRARYTGRRCFVMGNGPSLLKCDMNRLADEVTIVSNAHYLVWDKLSYKPTFLTVEDRLVAEDRVEELARLRDVTRIFPFDLRTVLGKADETKLYLNFHRAHRPFPKFSHNLARRAYWGGTVSFLNLQLASYLGCNPIILIGFDHSYVVPTSDIRDNVIHSQDADVNHIHPNYFGPGFRWHDPHVPRMELAYVCARQELEQVGVRVINATVEGHLEVFDRVPFDSITRV